MCDKELMDGIRRFKASNEYTLLEVGKKIGVSISTLERWLKTARINRVYARIVKERLGL
jgi:hypothetical protein